MFCFQTCLIKVPGERLIYDVHPIKTKIFKLIEESERVSDQQIIRVGKSSPRKPRIIRVSLWSVKGAKNVSQIGGNHVVHQCTYLRTSLVYTRINALKLMQYSKCVYSSWMKTWKCKLSGSAEATHP